MAKGATVDVPMCTKRATDECRTNDECEASYRRMRQTKRQISMESETKHKQTHSRATVLRSHTKLVEISAIIANYRKYRSKPSNDRIECNIHREISQMLY